MSDDDLGGYGTPPVRQAKTRVSRSQGNQVAGPSKPSSRSRQKLVELHHHEVIDVDNGQNEDELGSTTSIPTARGIHVGRNNTKVKPKSARAKGKARAQPLNSNGNMGGPGDDELQVVEESDYEMGGELNVGTSRSTMVVGEAVERKQYNELEKRLKREIKGREEMEQRCEDLTKQLEKIMRVRETEAEALMLAQKEQFEAEIAALERVNKELTTNLAKVEPLMRSGKTSVLHLLTREAADEENRKIENEVLAWRQQFEEAQEIIKEKDQLIKESAQREKEVVFELEVEKKNFLAYKAKTQHGSVRPQGDVLGSDKPQNLQLVRLYEDSTNLLIVGLKPQRSQYLNFDDWTATCVFTYVSSHDAKRHSLNFMLICRWERIDLEDDTPVKSKNQLHEMMYYEPLELDKESEEFIERLQHMGTAFSFTRDQLALFLRTLYNTLDEALHAGPEVPEEEVDVEIIE
ncbi:uncharacterized protein C8R40DRAFT_1112879 [Lentinula edodes]|uniref:uncharacterized protein n=1 Tax=Lentinula edodes TaxID=5353 RepID=UPI001E8E8A4D|nr:uncharacterized protein C8R40DRAFT_1112879 [Lentinula edodes]KAH7873628.1 hypothetical protein C8R40DRAFT_1112879 [Lentinula edodes]